MGLRGRPVIIIYLFFFDAVWQVFELGCWTERVIHMGVSGLVRIVGSVSNAFEVWCILEPSSVFLLERKPGAVTAST